MTLKLERSGLGHKLYTESTI